MGSCCGPGDPENRAFPSHVTFPRRIRIRHVYFASASSPPSHPHPRLPLSFFTIVANRSSLFSKQNTLRSLSSSAVSHYALPCAGSPNRPQPPADWAHLEISPLVRALAVLRWTFVRFLNSFHPRRFLSIPDRLIVTFDVTSKLAGTSVAFALDVVHLATIRLFS